LSAIQHFEKRAKSSGITSLTTSTDIKIPSNEPGRSTKLVEEKKIPGELHQESKRITDNAKAAALSG